MLKGHRDSCSSQQGRKWIIASKPRGSPPRGSSFTVWAAAEPQVPPKAWAQTPQPSYTP